MGAGTLELVDTEPGVKLRSPGFRSSRLFAVLPYQWPLEASQ